MPSNLRKSLLNELHSNHAGASRMKELARGYLWWPNLDKDIETLSSSCQKCLERRKAPAKAELHPWEWPGKPWHRIHVDYAGPIGGNNFLIIVDAHSKWVNIFKTNGLTSKETIKWLSHTFAQMGLPVSLVSDNGPCFISEEFKTLMKNCGVRHVTSAVYKPATNGLAERMVQTFKRALSVSKDPVQLTIDRFLFNYRCTPHSTTGVSPAELMYGRKLRSRLDLLWPMDSVGAKVSHQQEKQKQNHSSHPRKVEFAPFAPVIVRNYRSTGASWLPGTVEQRTGPVSYRCRLGDGTVVKRHLDQLQQRSVTSPQAEPPTSPEVPERLRESLTPEVSPHREISPQPLPEGTVGPKDKPPAEPSPSQVEPRRSTRIRKPVERLNLEW